MQLLHTTAALQIWNLLEWSNSADCCSEELQGGVVGKVCWSWWWWLVSFLTLNSVSANNTLSHFLNVFTFTRRGVSGVSEYLQHQLIWVWEEAFNKYFHCSFGRLHTLIIDHEPGNILIINSWVHVEMIRIFTPQLAHLSQVFSHYNEPICWTIFQWQVSSEVYLNVSPGVKLSIQLKTFTSHCAHVQHSPEMQSFDNFYFNKTS